MTDLAAVKAMVYGRVQGVFFRDFVSRQATALGLSGYVRNVPEGNVEVEAEGEVKKLDELVSYLKIGPPASRVEKMETTWSEYAGCYTVFEIRY
ncbi:acylphosphatase [Chloroflexota bacterium]